MYELKVNRCGMVTPYNFENVLAQNLSQFKYQSKFVERQINFTDCLTIMEHSLSNKR